MTQETEMLVIGGPANGTTHTPVPGEKYYVATVVEPTVSHEVPPTERLKSNNFQYRRFRVYPAERWSSFEVWIPYDVSDAAAPRYICECAAFGANNVDIDRFTGQVG